MIMNATLPSNVKPSNAPENAIEVYQEPSGLRIFRLSLFSMVIFTSLVGNFIICKAVWKITRRKPFSYYLVANLAVAELINSLCQAFILVYMEKGSWIFGEAMCILVNPLLVLSMFVITNSLAVIAVYSYRVTLERRRPKALIIAGIIIGLWIMALVITLPLFITRKLDKISEDHFRCASYFPGDSTANYNRYTIVRLLFTFAVPYFVIPSAYLALAIKLKLYVHRIDKEEDDTANIGLSAIKTLNGAAKPWGVDIVDKRLDNNTVGPEEREQNLQNRRRNGKVIIDTAENHLTKMVFVIILIFLACYLPYQGYFLWEYFGKFNNWQFYYQKLLLDYLFVLKCLPSALHPICWYATMNSIFTRAFPKVVACPCSFKP
ncbi:probable G-protein coupled receptor 83 [Stylophora pistillata]|uniref:probable G-protein coupled receptor 83 n=1 Tax=Stylophora pistillata TaxID=50429 RepID=UPI000C03E2B4|nr:probable G-protein coupled receptor 83 [Stylophora pistillata]